MCDVDLPPAWQNRLKHTMRIGTQNKLCAIIAILFGRSVGYNLRVSGRCEMEYSYALHTVTGKSTIGPDAEGNVVYELEMVNYGGKVKKWVSKEFFNDIMYGDMIETVLRRV